jgi:hypothetical protein
MTFQDPGARSPVNIEVRFPRGGPAPFNPDTDSPEYEPPQKATAPAAAPEYDPDKEPEYEPPAVAAAPPELNSIQRMTVDFQNQMRAAAQGVTPNVNAHAENLLGDIELDEADQPFYKDKKGKLVPIDQSKHVILQDPTDGRMKAFARSPKTEENILAGLGRFVIGGSGPEAIGSRVIAPVRAAQTAGQKAGQTAAELGKPLPQGLTSDRPWVQGLTAKMQSVPIVGSRIRSMVGETAQAAGERVGGIAGEMGGGVADRATADALMRPALQDVIEANNAKADQLYSDVRGQINPDRPYELPRTKAMLDRIVAQRQAAGWANPEQGLEQFRNVSERGSFNGAHRARVDARNAGNVASPNPGYNKADYNNVTRALTADIRNLAHTEGGQKAVDAFDKAETEFGKMAKQNDALHKIVNARGEASIATVLNAAKEEGGNLKLLTDLKRSMSPEDFNTIGGTLLRELGKSAGQAEDFSLAKFATNWEKLSPRARTVLFNEQHQKDIEDIVGMSKHIKRALKETNTAHTADTLIVFDTLRDIALFAASAAAGTLTGATAAGAAGGAAMVMLAHWLASPAKARAMAEWAKSYRVLKGLPIQGAAGQSSARKAAVFSIATRNLANNLGVPVEQIMSRAARTNPYPENPEQSPQRPVDQQIR